MLDANVKMSFKKNIAFLNDQVHSIISWLAFSFGDECIQITQHMGQISFLSIVEGGKAPQYPGFNALPEHGFIGDQKHWRHHHWVTHVQLLGKSILDFDHWIGSGNESKA